MAYRALRELLGDVAPEATAIRLCQVVEAGGDCIRRDTNVEILHPHLEAFPPPSSRLVRERIARCVNEPAAGWAYERARQLLRSR